MTLVGGFTHHGNRAQVLASLRATHVTSLVLGLGLAAVATFWHMPAPKPLGGLQYKIPSYVKSLENHSSSFVNESLAFGISTDFLFGGSDGTFDFSENRLLGQELKLVEVGVEDVVGNFLEDAELGDSNKNDSSISDQQPRFSF